MTSTKNITRYQAGLGNTYAFMGWRLCITRQKQRFVRYFSDREYGDGESAFAAALAMRDEILGKLADGQLAPAELFRRYRKQYS